MTLHFEDFLDTAEVEMGSCVVDADEVVAFARRFDPQAIHMDAGRAAAGPFGGLIASGFHTLAMMMRVACDGYLLDANVLGSPGLEDVKWLAPVRPGDTLRVTRRTLEAVPSRSKADRGSIYSLWTATNQDGTCVSTVKAWGIFMRRPA